MEDFSVRSRRNLGSEVCPPSRRPIYGRGSVGTEGRYQPVRTGIRGHTGDVGGKDDNVSRKSMSILEQWRAASAEVREYERKRKDPVWEAKRKLLLREAKERRAALLASFARAIKEVGKGTNNDTQRLERPSGGKEEELASPEDAKEQDCTDTPSS